MIFGNSSQRAQVLEALRAGEKVLCLAGDRYLGKSSFLREELPSIASESDLLFAEPGPDGAREACRFSSSEPVHGDARILVVEDASGMSDPAQDAYLKLLEEPPPSLRVVITASDPGAMHPAMRSRLRRIVRWSLLSEPEMAAFAATIDPLDPELSSMVRGRPGLYSRSHGKAYYKALFSAVRSAVAGSSDAFMDPVPEAVDRLAGDAEERSIVAVLCRLAAIASGGPPARVRRVLQFCSSLSVSSVNAGIHWQRMASGMPAL